MNITQRPPNTSTLNWCGTYDPIVFIVTDALAATLTEFQYVCRLTIFKEGYAKTLDPIKIYPNISDAGVFELQNIIRYNIELDVIIGTTPIFDSTAAALISNESVCHVWIDFGYTYVLNGVQQPVVYGILDEKLYVQNGTFSPPYGNRLQWNQNFYTLGGVSKRFLTSVRSWKVLPKSKAVIGFMNAVIGDNTDLAEKYVITTYDTTGTQLDTLTRNISSITGGSGVGKRLIWIPCGPINQGSYISMPTEGSYTIVLKNLSNIVISETFTFFIEDSCSFEPEMVMYQNSVGGYDTMSFLGNNTANNESIARSNFQQLQGNYNTADGTTIPFTSYAEDGGDKVFNMEIEKRITLYTGMVSESFNAQLKELMMSPLVFYYEGDSWSPVIVENSSVDYLSSITNQDFQYQVILRYSHKKQTTI
jgi:hypothetical protein